MTATPNRPSTFALEYLECGGGQGRDSSMATLIVEHEGRRSAALLSGRVVNGRRANSHVVVQDRTVSRIHAWIAHSAGKYFVVDSGSRVGTLVNGKPLRGRHPLADGDT